MKTIKCVFLALACLSGSANVVICGRNISQYLEKVNLTETGLSRFFTCYNDPFYVECVLSCRFQYMTDLLSYTKEQIDPYGYAYSTIGLFLQRTKGCDWINPRAFAQLLDQLPPLLQPVLNRTREKEALKHYISNQLTSKMKLFEKNNTLFVQEITDDIYNYLQVTTGLSDVFIRFLETTLDKLAWDPQENVYTWKSCKLIGQQLGQLYDAGIIHELDTLNQLLWSLVYRFCHFIDLWGASLSLEFYSEVKKDIPHTDFLLCEDQEKSASSKIQILTHALQIGEARATAYKHGILTGI